MDEYVSDIIMTLSGFGVFGEIGRSLWHRMMSEIALFSKESPFPPFDIYKLRHKFLTHINRHRNVKLNLEKYWTKTVSHFCINVAELLVGNEGSFIEPEPDLQMFSEEISRILELWPIIFEWDNSGRYKKMLQYSADSSYVAWLNINDYLPHFNFFECLKDKKLHCFKTVYGNNVRKILEDTTLWDLDIRECEYYKDITVMELYDAINSAISETSATRKSVTPKS